MTEKQKYESAPLTEPGNPKHVQKIVMGFDEDGRNINVDVECTQHGTIRFKTVPNVGAKIGDFLMAGSLAVITQGFPQEVYDAIVAGFVKLGYNEYGERIQ